MAVPAALESHRQKVVPIGRGASPRGSRATAHGFGADRRPWDRAKGERRTVPNVSYQLPHANFTLELLARIVRTHAC
jgi:hypothetical protein